MARRRIKDQRVLITGASSGIGFELARLMSQKQAIVLATARRESELNRLVAEANSPERFHVIAGDITDPDHRQRLVAWIDDNWGSVDTVINNAGVGSLGRFDESSEQSLRDVMEVNFFAPVELIRLTMPRLKKGNRPIIVNIGSVLGHRAVPEKSEYCASKFAIHGFSDALRAELAGKIDVLLVSPSTTRSEFFDHVIDNHSERDWTPRQGMSPELVARKTISAIRSGKHEIILSLGGKGLVMLDRLAPSLADRIVSRFG